MGKYGFRLYVLQKRFVQHLFLELFVDRVFAHSLCIQPEKSLVL